MVLPNVCTLRFTLLGGVHFYTVGCLFFVRLVHDNVLYASNKIVFQRTSKWRAAF